MAARRPASVCAFCRARHTAAALARRNNSSTTRLHQTALVALRPEDESFLHVDEYACGEGTIGAVKERLDDSLNGLREAVRDFDALWKQRDERVQVLRKLRNQWPDVGGKHLRSGVHKERPVLPEAQAALVPHAVFRRKVREAIAGKPLRLVLRVQLLRCEQPRDILRIVAVAMMDRAVAQNLALLSEAILRAVYRCRQNVSDPECLRCLTTIITRFQYANIQVAPLMLFSAVKFAARARSLPHMQRLLRTVRQANLPMSSNVFRSIIAKCSIGHRGLGEIRNGRWRRADLLHVLTGFEDEAHLPPEEQNHLGTFLDRADWQFLHGWVAVLARCKASQEVWHEWLLWKTNRARLKPRTLVFAGPGPNNKPMTTRSRGDYWFVEQTTYAGDMEHAWQVLAETGVNLSSLKIRVKDMLLEGVEHAPTCTDTIREELISKCDRDLAKIEGAMGVKWIRQDGGEDGQGRHELFMDQEEALDKLGEDGWRLDDDYGFPWETDPIVLQQERSLHSAPESDD